MFELSPAKKLLILLSLSTAFAIVLSAVVLLSNHFAPSDEAVASVVRVTTIAPAESPAGGATVTPVLAAAAASPGAGGPPAQFSTASTRTSARCWRSTASTATATAPTRGT